MTKRLIKVLKELREYILVYQFSKDKYPNMSFLKRLQKTIWIKRHGGKYQ